MTGDDEKSSPTPASSATQTVTKSYVKSHRLPCREVPIDKPNIYRNAQEVNEAVRNGNFEHRKTTMWFKGRLYFLCEE